MKLYRKLRVYVKLIYTQKSMASSSSSSPLSLALLAKKCATQQQRISLQFFVSHSQLLPIGQPKINPRYYKYHQCFLYRYIEYLNGNCNNSINRFLLRHVTKVESEEIWKRCRDRALREYQPSWYTRLIFNHTIYAIIATSTALNLGV